MKPVLLDPEGMMRACFRDHSYKSRVLTRIEAIQASYKRDDTISALADQVVPGERPAEKEGPMCAERTVAVGQTTLTDAFAGISVLIEDTLTALDIPEGQNRV